MLSVSSHYFLLILLRAQAATFDKNEVFRKGIVSPHPGQGLTPAESTSSPASLPLPPFLSDPYFQAMCAAWLPSSCCPASTLFLSFSLQQHFLEGVPKFSLPILSCSLSKPPRFTFSQAPILYSCQNWKYICIGPLGMSQSNLTLSHQQLLIQEFILFSLQKHFLYLVSRMPHSPLRSHSCFHHLVFSSCFLYLFGWIICISDIWMLGYPGAPPPTDLIHCHALNTIPLQSYAYPQPRFLHKLQIHIVNLLTSPWMFNRHFKLNICLKMSSWNSPHFKHALLMAILSFQLLCCNLDSSLIPFQPSCKSYLFCLHHTTNFITYDLCWNSQSKPIIRVCVDYLIVSWQSFCPCLASLLSTLSSLCHSGAPLPLTHIK